MSLECFHPSWLCIWRKIIHYFLSDKAWCICSTLWFFLIWLLIPFPTPPFLHLAIQLPLFLPSSSLLLHHLWALCFLMCGVFLSLPKALWASPCFMLKLFWLLLLETRLSSSDQLKVSPYASLVQRLTLFPLTNGRKPLATFWVQVTWFITLTSNHPRS
jgi:hypothetical protein